MNKKFLTVAILIIVIPFMAYSSIFQLGGGVAWNTPIYTESETPFSFSNINFANYDVGIDGRINLGVLQLQGEVRGHFSPELLLENYSYNLASSLHLEFFFIDLTAGLGLNISVAKDAESNEWLYNGQYKGGAKDVFASSVFYYRAGLGIDFGPFSIETQATSPTAASWYSLNEVKEQKAWDVIKPQLDKTKVSISILFNFL